MMREVSPPWKGVVLVCTNERAADAPKASCGAASGAALRDWLKHRAKSLGLKGQILTTRTGCLDVCSPLGVTIAIVPDGGAKSLFIVAPDTDREAVWAEIAKRLT